MNVSIDIKDNSLNARKEHCWKKEDVEALRNMIKAEKNLTARTDDTFLLGCLRARKFDLQRAFKLVKNYYSVRKKYSEMYTDFTPSSMEKYLKEEMMGYLPHTDHEGHVITLGRASHWDASKIHAKEVMRCALLFGDLLLNNHLVQESGCIIVIDCSTASLGHALQITPVLAYRIASIMLGAYPLRYKAIHLLNVSFIVRGIVAIFLPFFPIKIKNRIHIHPNVESLSKAVPPQYLPCDFGGDLPPFDPSPCNENFRIHEQFFREHEKYWRATPTDS